MDFKLLNFELRFKQPFQDGHDYIFITKKLTLEWQTSLYLCHGIVQNQTCLFLGEKRPWSSGWKLPTGIHLRCDFMYFFERWIISMISNESITSKSCQTIHPKQIRATISTVTIAYKGIIFTVYMHITYIIQVSLFLHSHEFLKKNILLFPYKTLTPLRSQTFTSSTRWIPKAWVFGGHRGGADTEANIWWKKHNFLKVDFLGVFLLYPRHLWNLQ